MTTTEVATFAGGCFWCTEAIFERLMGVFKVTSGYSGGDIENPTYEDVSTSESRHAEAIQIEFDPLIINYEKLLLVFFKTHDPTTINRQGADIGTQYRSVVFYHNEDQKVKINKVINTLEQEKVYSSKIITEIVPYKNFFKAEEYHQNYYKRNSDAMYCQVVINPKLAKLEKEFGELIQR